MNDKPDKPDQPDQPDKPDKSDKPENKAATPRQIQIKIDDAMASGVYSNMAMIHHNDSEFVIDFLYVQPQQPRATVRARVITSPRHVKRLIKVLQEQLQHYESHHGTVEPAPPMAGPGTYH